MSGHPVIMEYVTAFLGRREVFSSLANAFGSPLYILEQEVLIQKARAFRNAFEAELGPVGCFYAMKSNHLPFISQTLCKEGFGLDVSSGVELETALSANAKEIIFSGPGKTPKELEMAVAESDRVVVLIDSEGELDRLIQAASGIKKQIRVGIRVNIQPQGLWRKFGLRLERVVPLWERIGRVPGLRFSGLQFHSSWNMNPDRQVENIRLMGEFLSQVPDAFLRQLAFLDAGGGFWPPQGEWVHSEDRTSPKVIPAVPITGFARAIAAALRQYVFPYVRCRICFEPGRWICHDAMHILLQVLDKKQDDLVITDGGTNMVGWERFETDYFPVLNLSRPGCEEHACHILGSLCTPHDVWGFSYYGSDIQVGDLLMIPTQGAYTYSLRQNFIKALPDVVLLEESRVIA